MRAVEQFERFDATDLVRQRFETIVLQAKDAKHLQVPKRGWDCGETIVVCVDFLQESAVAELGREPRKLIVATIEHAKPRASADLEWKGIEGIVRHVEVRHQPQRVDCRREPNEVVVL